MDLFFQLDVMISDIKNTSNSVSSPNPELWMLNKDYVKRMKDLKISSSLKRNLDKEDENDEFACLSATKKNKKMKL